MYEPPIEMFTSPIHDAMKQIQEQQDNYVYKCVLNVGVNVDKEELIRALKYDRAQYEKGYMDGLEEFAEICKRCFPSIACVFDALVKETIKERF